MKSREEQFAIFIINNLSTVRACAKHFNISKSTVHKDLTTKLNNTNKFLYYKVRQILDINLKERHIRGGLSTKQKYAKLNKKAKNS